MTPKLKLKNTRVPCKQQHQNCKKHPKQQEHHTNNDQNIISITQTTQTRGKHNLSVAQITTSKLEQGTMTWAGMVLGQEPRIPNTGTINNPP